MFGQNSARSFLFFGGCLIGSIFLISPLHAQSEKKSYRLSECVEIALKNNPDILLSAAGVESANIEMQQSVLNLSPSINGSMGQYYQSGRSIDRFTNQFVQTTVGNSSFQLQGNWVVFAGGQLKNAVKQSKYNYQASALDLIQSKQNMALSVSLAYLQVMQAREQLKAARVNSESLQQELKRTEKLLALGASNEGVVLSARAQYFNARSQETQALNQYKNRLLNLKGMLVIPFDEPFEIADNEVTLPSLTNGVVLNSTLFDSILNRRADYQSSMYRAKAAEVGVKIAKGAFTPSLSLGGSLSTIYSDNAKRISGYTITGVQPIGIVRGSNEIVEAPVFSYNAQTIEFNNQIKDNFGQAFGATLSVPVFGQLQTHSQVKRAQVAVTQAQLNQRRLKQSIVNEVTLAFQNFENASAQYDAAEQNYEVQKRNLEFVQKRMDLGQATVFEMQMAKNNEVSAYQSFLNAKYEATLRYLIIETLYLNNLEALNQF
jgi:outer membrane protein